MLTDQKLLFVGGGAMGSAIIGGLLKEGVCTPERILVSEPLATQREHLARAYGVATTDDTASAVEDRDIIVLSVKPQVLSIVGDDIQGRSRPDALIVSIMAGASIRAIQQATGHGCIVRAMPNTPAQVLAGITMWTGTATVTASQKSAVRTLFGAVGEEKYTAAEDDIDKATALNGSGPGYLFLILEALIDAGVHIGLSRADASLLALETFHGTAALARAMADSHPAELRNMVTSPAGTTAAGLLVMERAGLRGTLIESVAAAYRRSQELDT